MVVDGAGRVTLGKAFSTPPDFSAGIFDAVGVAAAELGRTTRELLSDTSLFLHSTTVAENAVVDGTLAPAGIITSRGFEDSLLATRGGYGRWSGLTEEEKRNPIEQDKLPPIVDRGLIEGIRERTDAHGRQHVAPDAAEIEAAVERLLVAGVQAIGVCLLWSFANPAAERAVADAVRRLRPDVFLTLSHEVAPVVGEYERTSTVALNARLGPVVGRYLEALARGLAEQGFGGTLLVAQAYGGLLPLEEAARRPVGMIESGPAAGLVGSKRLGELIGAPNVIAADMGGTTFKVGVIRQGRIEYQRESLVLRYHYALPKLDVVSLGLAGGSIVSLDPRTGTPRIGPRSAGSYPGPVCYGHGGREPTITDVDAILGYLNPEFFLGGRERLDVGAAHEAFEELVARPLGMDVIEAAAAMYRLANSRFTDLLHRTTVQRGLDPRRFALFSFGGTAGMHVCAYGAALGVAQIVVPHSASVHGAFGLAGSDVTHEDQTTHLLREPFDAAAAQQRVRGPRGAGRRAARRGRLRAVRHAPRALRGHALPPPGARRHRAGRHRCGERSVARRGDGALRGALPGEVRCRGRLPRSGHRARRVPRARVRGRPQAGARGAAAREPGHSRCAGGERARLGRRDRPARGSPGVQLRAAAPRQPAPGPGSRVDADHDRRRRARLRGLDGPLPQPRAGAAARSLKPG